MWGLHTGPYADAPASCLGINKVAGSKALPTHRAPRMPVPQAVGAASRLHELWSDDGMHIDGIMDWQMTDTPGAPTHTHWAHTTQGSTPLLSHQQCQLRHAEG